MAESLGTIIKRHQAQRHQAHLRAQLDYIFKQHGGTMPKFGNALKAPKAAPKNRRQYRQGDVLVEAVDFHPSHVSASRKVVAANDGRLILAYGEESGHAHAVLDDNASLVELNGTLYLVVDEPGATITHEEHPAIELPTGEYKVTRQRQYSPDKASEWVYD